MIGVESEKRGREYVSFKKQIRMQEKAAADAEEGSRKYEHLQQEYQEHLKSKRG